MIMSPLSLSPALLCVTFQGIYRSNDLMVPSHLSVMTNIMSSRDPGGLHQAYKDLAALSRHPRRGCGPRVRL